MDIFKKYKCHKEVKAFKITNIEEDIINLCFLLSGEPSTDKISVSKKWIEKHNPEIGGYYVQYEDDYSSYSPAGVFDKGYDLIEQNA